MLSGTPSTIIHTRGIILPKEDQLPYHTKELGGGIVMGWEWQETNRPPANKHKVNQINIVRECTADSLHKPMLSRKS